MKKLQYANELIISWAKSVSKPSLYVNQRFLGDLRIILLIIAASLVFQKAFFYRIIDL